VEAQLLQGLDVPLGDRQVVDHRALGDFEAYPVGQVATPGQPLDHLQEPAAEDGAA
jgi:hypothetical protein